MSQYAVAGLRRLERYINRQLLVPETITTSLQEVAFLMKLNKDAKKKTGYSWEVSTRRLRTTDTAKTFLPWDTGTDFVGDNPTTYPANTYTRKDPTRNMVVKAAFVHDEIRLNEFEIDALDTPAKFVDYFQESGDEMRENIEQFLANQILRGLGDGQEGATNGVASDMYGLYLQGRHSTFSANTNNDAANSHFGLLRHEFPGLVGREFSANQVDTVAATQKIIIANCTLTNGDTEISFAAEDLSTAANGWMVVVKTAGGVIVSQGYEHRIGFTDGGGADTTLQSTQIFRGITASTYTVELFPFFNDDKEGDAGTWNVNKLYKVQAACIDKGKPNMGTVDSSGFYQFMAHLEAKQQWIKGSDAILEQAGFDNFKFGSAVMTIDEHEDAGSVSFYNTKYVRLCWHTKYGIPKIKKGTLMPDKSGRHIGSLVGDMIMVGQVYNVSPKNSGRVTDLPIF